ncbi:Maf family protein [Desulfonatronospira sp.]|uniref:Maf family protein n=1 Tax=Desulfonatronospira sp. TaxID=1962951 RepID=UPI0025C2E782|nr:Maf family protein [Desulfonatronospira sp.]
MNTEHPHFKQGPFRSIREIILASASPRRQMLLATLGLNFRVLPADLKEPPIDPGEQPGHYVLEMSGEKCRIIAEQNTDSVVLGADTVVVLDGEVMGKPDSREHALDMLLRLQGNTHEVITGVCLQCTRMQIRTRFSVTTRVEMIPADQEMLQAYIDTGEPRDKAGGYAIQGVGAFLISAVTGSYTNVVGLPLDRVMQALLQLEAICLQADSQ